MGHNHNNPSQNSTQRQALVLTAAMSLALAAMAAASVSVSASTVTSASTSPSAATSTAAAGTSAHAQGLAQASQKANQQAEQASHQSLNDQSDGQGLKPLGGLVRGTFERWKIDDGNRAGMLGLGLLFDVHSNVRLGVGSYASITGSSGGLMAFGFSGEIHKQLSQDWGMRTGVFVGGGGGALGEQLTGIGLVLRADAGVTYNLGPYGNVGVGVSWVTFPSGQIGSAQPYLSYEYPFYFAIEPSSSASGSGTSGSEALAGSLSSRRQELALGGSYFVVPDSVTNGSGVKQGNMELAGIRWTQYLDKRWFASLQVDGSYTSSTSGYMQILGGLGYRLPLTPTTGLKFYAQAGAGGAGNNVVDTGGGLLLGGGMSLQQMLSKRWAIELNAGGLKATNGDFKAWVLGVNLSYVFGMPDISQPAEVAQTALGYRSLPLRFRVLNETFFKADDQWRNNDDLSSVSNFGLAADYFINQHAYLTAQGLVAYTGNARSSSVTAVSELTGLFGAGWRQPIAGDWFVQAEGLLGASGGGTMDTGNGAVWQVNAGLGYQLTESLSVALTGGRMQAFDGQFKANMVGVSLGYRFGLPTRDVRAAP